jgi:hypothetical protein
MGLIFSILALGLMASLSPATIVVFIVVLGTARARVNAAAFLVGWAVSLTVVFTASYLLGSSHEVRQGSGRTGLLVVEVLVGCALVAVGVRQWRRRHAVLSRPGGSDGSGTWTGRLDSLGPRGAVLVGVLKQPWAITTAAAVVIAHHHSSFLVTLIAFMCFVAASTASVGAMYLYYARRPGEATAYLAGLRNRMVAAGPTVFAVAAVAIGTVVVLDALAGLRSR